MRGKPRTVEFEGVQVAVTSLAVRFGVPLRTLHARIFQMGWSVADAVSKPVTRRRGRSGRTAKDVPRGVPQLKKRADDGSAYVRWKHRGANHVRRLGRYGSKEAAEGYRRFAADWLAGKYEGAAEGEASAGGATVAAVVGRWLSHIEKTHVKDGRQTSAVAMCRSVSLIVNRLFGASSAADFRPEHLREVRNQMVEAGMARVTVNQYTRYAVALFKWAGSMSMVPAAVFEALKLVEPLKPGRTAAPDRERKRPATDAQVEATLPHLCPREPDRGARVAAMIRIQRLAGMRPGEICAMERGEIDTSADVWHYVVGKANKNRHRGKVQDYYLGPRAVAILKPYLDAAPATGSVFGEIAADYARAIRVASVKAGARWSPHQLRHALATAVAERFRSLEHAAAAIGDTAAVASAVYVHIDPKQQVKIEVARAMG